MDDGNGSLFPTDGQPPDVSRSDFDALRTQLRFSSVAPLVNRLEADAGQTVQVFARLRPVGDEDYPMEIPQLLQIADSDIILNPLTKDDTLRRQVKSKMMKDSKDKRNGPDRQSYLRANAARIDFYRGDQKQTYGFTKILDQHCGQGQAFETSASQLCEGFVEGRSGLLLTYGSTGTGKTYSILGNKQGDNPGILIRSIRKMFDLIGDSVYTGGDIQPTQATNFKKLTEPEAANLKRERNLRQRIGDTFAKTATSVLDIEEEDLSVTQENSTVVRDSEQTSPYLLAMSVVEIYNEKVHDLLGDCALTLAQDHTSTSKLANLRIYDDSANQSYIQSLQWFPIKSETEALQLVGMATKAGAFATTNANESSSRAHTLFRFRLTRVHDSGDVLKLSHSSEYIIVDLAGSESATAELGTATRGTQSRRQEGKNINQSLLRLKMCLEGIAAAQSKHAKSSKGNEKALPKTVLNKSHIRSCKLTRILAPFFTIYPNITMVLCLSPSYLHINEFVQACQFGAEKASKIRLFDAIPSNIVTLKKKTAQAPRKAVKMLAKKFNFSKQTADGSKASNGIDMVFSKSKTKTTVPAKPKSSTTAASRKNKNMNAAAGTRAKRQKMDKPQYTKPATETLEADYNALKFKYNVLQSERDQLKQERDMLKVSAEAADELGGVDTLVELHEKWEQFGGYQNARYALLDCERLREERVQLRQDYNELKKASFREIQQLTQDYNLKIRDMKDAHNKARHQAVNDRDKEHRASVEAARRQVKQRVNHEMDQQRDVHRKEMAEVTERLAISEKLREEQRERYEQEIETLCKSFEKQQQRARHTESAETHSGEIGSFEKSARQIKDLLREDKLDQDLSRRWTSSESHSGLDISSTSFEPVSSQPLDDVPLSQNSSCASQSLLLGRRTTTRAAANFSLSGLDFSVNSMDQTPLLPVVDFTETLSTPKIDNRSENQEPIHSPVDHARQTFENLKIFDRKPEDDESENSINVKVVNTGSRYVLRTRKPLAKKN